ncbi:alpha/beta hydrolase [Salinicola avicenniae]|uniref:alpha/beta hydrolase n=1 Tax=Salinicola avicenniae TaxID=2916836 RepID=UPI0020739C50|nr:MULTISPECIES: alpha/beta hydrolase-fold protein [unclassified Salinicola]
MENDPVTLPGSQQWQRHAEATGRDYLIQVSVPDAPVPANGYPVLYVLDGNARFPLAVAAREALTLESPQGGVAPWLIVGIGYPETLRFDGAARSEDYTPSGEGLPMKDARGRPQGGADRFLEFIEDELKPELAQRFAVDRSRSALLGHSYGGLFALHVALTHPRSFSDYIAVSPSLWWGDSYLFRELGERDRARGEASPALRLLIGVGDREISRRPTALATDTGESAIPAMRDNAVRMADALMDRFPRWQIVSTRFAGAGHGDVMWPAMQAVWPFLDKKEQGDRGAQADSGPH